MLLSPQTHSHGYKTWFAFKKTDAYILLIKYKLKSCSMIFWFVFLSRSLRKVFFSLSPCLEGMFSFETNACVCLFVYIFIYFRPISLLWLLILFISHRDVTKSDSWTFVFVMNTNILFQSFEMCLLELKKKKKEGNYIWSVSFWIWCIVPIIVFLQVQFLIDYKIMECCWLLENFGLAGNKKHLNR